MALKGIYSDLKKSITFKLLKVVFSVYIFITLVTTLGHMSLEYQSATKKIKQQMAEIEEIIIDGLSEAIWVYNLEQIYAVLGGALKTNLIVGSKVTGEDGNQYAVGLILDKNSKVVNIRYGQVVSRGTRQKENLLEHKFNIYYRDSDTGNLAKIGAGALYASSSAAFDLVKLGFILIVVNAVLKTLALWFLFIWFGKTYISYPLNSMRQYTHRISQGDFSSRELIKVDSSSGTDLDDLCQSLASMAEELYLVQEKLIKSNDKLLRVNSSLSEFQDRLACIVNVMPSILVGVTEDTTIIAWNTKAERLIGLKPENAIGKKLQDIHPFFSKYTNLIYLAGKTGKIQERKKVVERTISGTKYYDALVYPVIGHHYRGAVLMISDVTSNVKITESIMHTEKMNSIGTLAADITKKISQPLHEMVQHSTDLSELVNLASTRTANFISKDDTEAVFNFLHKNCIGKKLKKLVSLGKKSESIVADLLRFTGKLQGIKSLANLQEVSDEAIKHIDAEMAEKNRHSIKVKVIRKYIKDLPHIFCYPREIERVIVNILRNSYDCFQKSDIEPRITIEFSVATSNVIICIEDNGPGMEEEVLKRAFEPFFSGKNTNGDGSGMGLAICHGIIVESHSGTIVCENTLPHGCKFTISLPFVPNKDLE